MALKVSMEFSDVTRIHSRKGAEKLSWGGTTAEMAVAYLQNIQIEKQGSAYVCILKDGHPTSYITPEAALEMAFALFDIVEKVKPSLIQNDGPKS